MNIKVYTSCPYFVIIKPTGRGLGKLMAVLLLNQEIVRKRWDCKARY
jgi:hypothetical protein